MFRGTYEHTVDPKGRVSVPARFREVILASNDDRVMVTKFRSDSLPCLDVYRLPEWIDLEQRIDKLPKFDPKIRTFTLYYISSAQECQLDKQGRILLPPMLRSYAKLGESVVFAAFTNRFQIFDQAIWEQMNEHAERAIFEESGGFLAELGI